jgi:Xaa-Pro aminopeptidase
MISLERCARGRYSDLDRIRRAVDEGPFDAVVCSSPENIPYFSGFYNHDIRIFPERAHFIVWSRGSEPVFIAYQKRARMLDDAATFITDVRDYAGEGTDSMRVLADLLRERGVDGPVGIEYRALPSGHLLALQERLPEIVLRDSQPFLEEIRSVKTQAEIEVISRIATITSEAIDTAFDEASVGDTERSISARAQYELLKGGAEVIAAAFFGSRERSGSFHPYAADVPIGDGTLIKIDCGGQMDGYFSDIARTVVMGEPSARQREMHAKLTEVRDRVVDHIRPGMTAGEVFDFGRRQYQELGVDMKWAMLGHSIGLAEHEEPQLQLANERLLQPNMTLMVEAGYTDPPKDSFSVEDLVLVTSTGARYLTDTSRHHVLREIG